METAYRYDWCAASKTVHLAVNGTGSHRRNGSQRQKQWLTNCVLMGLFKTKKKRGPEGFLPDFLFHRSTWCQVYAVGHLIKKVWRVDSQPVLTFLEGPSESVSEFAHAVMFLSRLLLRNFIHYSPLTSRCRLYAISPRECLRQDERDPPLPLSEECEVRCYLF